MNQNDQVIYNCGAELIRMIRYLFRVGGKDVAYSKRAFTFPGGKTTVFVVKTDELANFIDDAINKKYNVTREDI